MQLRRQRNIIISTEDTAINKMFAHLYSGGCRLSAHSNCDRACTFLRPHKFYCSKNTLSLIDNLSLVLLSLSLSLSLLWCVFMNAWWSNDCLCVCVSFDGYFSCFYLAGGRQSRVLVTIYRVYSALKEGTERTADAQRERERERERPPRGDMLAQWPVTRDKKREREREEQMRVTRNSKGTSDEKRRPRTSRCLHHRCKVNSQRAGENTSFV